MKIKVDIMEAMDLPDGKVFVKARIDDVIIEQILDPEKAKSKSQVAQNIASFYKQKYREELMGETEVSI